MKKIKVFLINCFQPYSTYRELVSWRPRIWLYLSLRQHHSPVTGNGGAFAECLNLRIFEHLLYKRMSQAQQSPFLAKRKGAGVTDAESLVRTGELFGTGDEAVSQSQGQASEFESFVEHALSPLGHYGQESPSQQPFSQRSIESHVGIGLSQSIEGSQLSMGVPTSNDWSPSVAAGSSLPAGNDLKSFFGDSVLNSPIVPHPRMRHKGLKGQADYTADFSVVLTSTSTATSHNLGQGQGIAERQGADGPQAQVAKRTGPPTSNKRPRNNQQQEAAEPLQMEAPTRRSGRSKVPSKDYAVFELGDFTASSEPDAARAFAPVGAPSIGVTKARSPRPASAASSSSSARASAGGGRFSSSSTLMSPSGGVVRCHCKKSRCLKLYCECLHALKLCSGCSCYECENNASNPALTDIIEGIREVSTHLVAIVCVLRQKLFLKPLSLTFFPPSNI